MFAILFKSVGRAFAASQVAQPRTLFSVGKKKVSVRKLTKIFWVKKKFLLPKQKTFLAASEWILDAIEICLKIYKYKRLKLMQTIWSRTGRLREPFGLRLFACLCTSPARTTKARPLFSWTLKRTIRLHQTDKIHTGYLQCARPEPLSEVYPARVPLSLSLPLCPKRVLHSASLSC